MGTVGDQNMPPQNMKNCGGADTRKPSDLPGFATKQDIDLQRQKKDIRPVAHPSPSILSPTLFYQGEQRFKLCYH